MAEDNTEEKKQLLQQKYMEMQMIAQQIQQIQKQVELIENQLQELTVTKEALKTIGETKEGNEILVPLASGIFIKANLKDNKDVVVNVGSGTAVKKSLDEAGKLIEEQEKELADFKEELGKNLEKLTENARSFEKELTALAT